MEVGHGIARDAFARIALARALASRGENHTAIEELSREQKATSAWRTNQRRCCPLLAIIEVDAYLDTKFKGIVTEIHRMCTTNCSISS